MISKLSLSFVFFSGRHNSAKHLCVTKKTPISAEPLKSLYPCIARYQDARYEKNYTYSYLNKLNSTFPFYKFNNLFYANTLLEIAEYKGAFSSLFPRVTFHNSKICTNQRCQIYFVYNQEV